MTVLLTNLVSNRFWKEKVENESCGQHVHVDASNHTPQSLKNALTIMYAKEDILFKALKVQERRANSYCQRVQPEVLEKIRKIPNRSITMDRVRNVWYGGRDRSHIHYDDTRYYALNLHAVFSKGTLEWRCSLAISAQAINQRSTQMKKTLISENPAFTFRTFLLRLGLVEMNIKMSENICWQIWRVILRGDMIKARMSV